MPRTRSLSGTTAVKIDEVKKEAGEPEIAGRPGSQSWCQLPTQVKTQFGWRKTAVKYSKPVHSPCFSTRMSRSPKDSDVAGVTGHRLGTALEHAGKGKRMEPKWGHRLLHHETAAPLGGGAGLGWERSWSLVHGERTSLGTFQCLLWGSSAGLCVVFRSTRNCSMPAHVNDFSGPAPSRAPSAALLSHGGSDSGAQPARLLPWSPTAGATGSVFACGQAASQQHFGNLKYLCRGSVFPCV